MKNTVQIYQWNVLAQSLADKVGFPKVDEDCLDWTQRWNLIKIKLTEVIENNGILVMEEVDPAVVENKPGMYKYISDFLDLHNYEHQWISKNCNNEKTKTGKKGKSVRDGTMIAWPQIFTNIGTLKIPLGKNSTQNAYYIILKDMRTDVIFIVCGVHLKSKPNFAEQRVEQVKIAIDGLSIISCDNVLFVGDFNDIPTSDCIKYIESKGFKSAYNLNNKLLTTAKVRKDLVIRCIDYIWYRGSYWGKIKSVRDLEVLSDFAQNYLPHKNHPSDHLMLGMKIEIDR